jgi:hypothetical protein
MRDCQVAYPPGESGRYGAEPERYARGRVIAAAVGRRRRRSGLIHPGLTGKGDVMADKDRLVVHVAAFSSVADAEQALATIEQLYKDGAVGTLDAAVIDKENGKPRVVKRMDRPGIRVIPEWFGGGALPRKEVREAAEQLTADQAGLLVVSSEPVIEKAVDKALTGAGQVAKHKVDATIDQITSELQEALKR